MSLSRLSFVRQITAQVQGRSSMESRVSTQSEISSNDAVVEIERLKADNQLQVEISALEAEAQEIELMGGGIEELEGATEEVSELQAAVESRLETGGLTKGEAEFVQLQLNAIEKRTGLVASTPSVESFSGSSQDRIDMTVASLEGIGDMLSNAWEAIKEFFRNICNKVKGWFGNTKKSAEKAKDKAEETAKVVEEAKSEGQTEVESTEAEAAKAGVVEADVEQKTEDPKTGDEKPVFNKYNPTEAIELTKQVIEYGAQSNKVVAETIDEMVKKAESETGYDGNSDGDVVSKVSAIFKGKLVIDAIPDNFVAERKEENDVKIVISKPLMGGKYFQVKFNPDGTINGRIKSAEYKDDVKNGTKIYKFGIDNYIKLLKEAATACAGVAKHADESKSLVDRIEKLIADDSRLSAALKGASNKGKGAQNKASIDMWMKIIRSHGQFVVTGPFTMLAKEVISQATNASLYWNKAKKNQKK